MTTRQRYLTTTDAAACVGLSRYTILRAVERGDIAVAGRTPAGWARFEPAVVEAYARRLLANGQGHPAPHHTGDADAEPPAAQPEETLGAVEQQFRSVTRLAHDAIISADAQGVITFWNHGAQRMFGYTEAEALARPLTLLMPARFRDAHQRGLARVTATGHSPLAGQTLALEGLRKDGTTFPIELSLSTWTIGEARFYSAIIRDGTARQQAEEALRQSEERFRALVEHTTDLIAVVDAQGLIRYASPSYERVLGYAPARLEGTPALDMAHPDDRARILEGMRQRAGAPGSTGGMAFRVRHADGSWRILDVTTANRLHDPAVRGIITTARDVTARTQAEEALRQSEERYREVERHAPIGLALVAPDGRWLRVNPALCALVGYTEDELGARTFQDITHPDDLDADLGYVRQMLAGEIATYQMEKRYVRRDGTLVWVLLSVSLVRDVADAPLYFIAQIQDIGARKRAEEELRRLALHDALTGLPNRALLHDRLGHALTTARRGGTPLALIMLDLDRFKEVNDTLGHDAGDTLLREVSRRLQGALRASDTVARLGGDEFAILLPGADTESAVGTARKLLAALVEPVTLREHAVVAGGSGGIALYPEHGADATTLLRQADVAMYAAKRGGTGYALYNPAQDQHSPRRLSLISALQRGIAHDELRLHYQPTVDMRTGQVHLVEALARWQHPEQGLLPPDAFIPLAEQTGLIVPLTRWVLATAVRQVRAWREGGIDLGVAVNLSARVLDDPDLPESIAALLDANAVPAVCLRVEVTESVVMSNPTRALAVLTRLATAGVRIAIDDFGTGYSSLAYLKRLPVDEIKIDKSFVTHMTTESDDATIVASTIGLGHSLGLRFVAEGVESRGTWQALDALGCDGAQGYYFSHALPADELARWLRETSWARGSADEGA